MDKQEMKNKIYKILNAFDYENESHFAKLHNKAMLATYIAQQLDEPSEARECEFKPRKIDGFATAVISFVEDDTELVECNLCSYIMGKRRLKKYCPNCGAKIIKRSK